jgi:hypothetical protein
MNWLKLVDALELDDKAVFNDVVSTERGPKSNAFVNDRDGDLVLKMQARLGELIEDAGIVRAFQESGSERGVHFQSGTDNNPTCFVGTYRLSSFVSVVSFVFGPVKQPECRP